MASDAKTKDFKPDRQIAVTGQMVAAGARVIESFAPNGMNTSVAETMASEVFAAMIAATCQAQSKDH